MNLTPNVVDLSHYEDVEDWDAVKAFGILAVINKATEGPGMTDKTFAIRRGPVARRGLHYGCYHFLRPGNLTAQLSHFLAVAEPDPSLVLAIDHEDRRVPLGALVAFAEALAGKTNRTPWLYSGFLIKEQLAALHAAHGTPDPILAKMPLWLSHYNPHPTWPDLWAFPRLIQFTGDGSGPGPHMVPGIKFDGAGIDINSYAGTPEQLAADWA